METWLINMKIFIYYNIIRIGLIGGEISSGGFMYAIFFSDSTSWEFYERKLLQQIICLGE